MKGRKNDVLGNINEQFRPDGKFTPFGRYKKNFFFFFFFCKKKSSPPEN
jgi:hypothetical protein